MCKSLTTVALVALLASVGFFAGGETVHAQFTACSAVDSATFIGTCSALPSKYSVTLLAFKLRRSDGTDHTLVSSSQACDVAAASANGDACVFGDTNLTIPAATYIGFKLELNRVFAGRVPDVTLTGRATCTASDVSTTIDVPASAGTLTFEGFGDNNLRVISTLASEITLTGDLLVDFTVTVNLAAGGLITFPAFPGACTGQSAGPLNMSLNFTCISGSCPSGP